MIRSECNHIGRQLAGGERLLPLSLAATRDHLKERCEFKARGGEEKERERGVTGKGNEMKGNDHIPRVQSYSLL